MFGFFTLYVCLIITINYCLWVSRGNETSHEWVYIRFVWEKQKNNIRNAYVYTLFNDIVV